VLTLVLKADIADHAVFVAIVVFEDIGASIGIAVSVDIAASVGTGNFENTRLSGGRRVILAVSRKVVSSVANSDKKHSGTKVHGMAASAIIRVSGRTASVTAPLYKSVMDRLMDTDSDSVPSTVAASADPVTGA